MTNQAQSNTQAQARLIERLRTRVERIVGAVDAHIHAGQVAFKMCREGMVLCDADVRGPGAEADAAHPGEGHAHSHTEPEAQPKPVLEGKEKRRRKGPAAQGKEEDEGWDVDIDPDESDDRGIAAPRHEHHKLGSSRHHFLLHHAHQGLELAQKTEVCFKEVRQEAYKVYFIRRAWMTKGLLTDCPN